MNSGTNDLIDSFFEMNKAQVAKNAEVAYRALGEILRLLPEHYGIASLADLHKRNYSGVINLFESEQALCNSAQHFHSSLTRLRSYLDDLQEAWSLEDPSLLTDISTLFGYLLQKYGNAFSNQDRASVELTLKTVLDVVAHDLVAVCKAQIQTLGRLMFAIVQEQKVVADKPRIVLVELPLGNTVPTKILHQFLTTHDFTVDLVRISLSRNDKKGALPTRRALLERRLKDTLRPGDLVIYLDEWMSGSNFRTVSNFMSRIVEQVPNARLLPVGLLTEDSLRAPNYPRHLEKHDKLLQKFGFSPGLDSPYRVVFPPLSGVVARPTRLYFFWSEHDRTSGYRKSQLLRVAFTNVDESIEKLMANEDAWDDAIHLYLMHRAETIRNEPYRNNISAVVFELREFLRQCLPASYADYQQVRQQLLAIEHPSNRGDCDDPIHALRELNKKIGALIDERPANLCVQVGVALAQSDFVAGSKESKDFSAHVPVIVDLEPPLRWFHERLLIAIIDEIGL